MSKKTFFEDLTNSIIADLENNIIPWEKPWFVSSMVNGKTGNKYRGSNQLALACAISKLNIESNDSRFVTFKQAQSMGWKIKKGSKSVVDVIFFSMLEKENDNKDGSVDDEVIKFPLLKSSAVFHASQVEGMPELQSATFEEFQFKPNELAQKIIDASKARIVTDPNRAYFSHADYIAVPPKEKFKSIEGYYGTLLHELAHWTGHKSRLNRDMNGRFGSEKYAREELVAEIASVFLCAETGIQYQAGNHTAYIKNWIQVLKSDPMEIHRASKKAMQVVEYLLDLAGIKE